MAHRFERLCQVDRREQIWSLSGDEEFWWASGWRSTTDKRLWESWQNKWRSPVPARWPVCLDWYGSAVIFKCTVHLMVTWCHCRQTGDRQPWNISVVFTSGLKKKSIDICLSVCLSMTRTLPGCLFSCNTMWKRLRDLLSPIGYLAELMVHSYTMMTMIVTTTT